MKSTVLSKMRTKFFKYFIIASDFKITGIRFIIPNLAEIFDAKISAKQQSLNIPVYNIISKKISQKYPLYFNVT